MTDERAQRVSHASGAGSGAPASEGVGGTREAKSPGLERAQKRPGLTDDELMRETSDGSQAAFE